MLFRHWEKHFEKVYLNLMYAAVWDRPDFCGAELCSRDASAGRGPFLHRGTGWCIDGWGASKTDCGEECGETAKKNR